MTERIFDRSLQFIFLVIPIACLYWVAIQWLTYGIDIPFYDDWREFDPGVFGSLAPAYLFQPVNDTLSVVGKLLDSLAIRIFHGNSLVYQFISMSVVLGGLLLLQYILLRAVVRDRLLCAAAFSLTILMFQPGSYWGLQNLAYQQALPIIFIMATIAIVVLSTWVWYIRSSILFVLGILAGFSYVSGAFGILAIALTLCVCIALNRQVFSTLLTDALFLLLAGSATTAIQLWLVLSRQQGHISTGTGWAFPTQPDFWLYLFGKIGRSLMLPQNHPSLSIVMVVIAVLICVIVTAVCLRNLASAKQRHSPTVRASIVSLLLLASVFCYLLLVTAGRTDLRDASVSKPLEVFAFGFYRFHFFWVTLIWPWVFVVVAKLWDEKPPAQRCVIAAAAGAVVIFAITQGVFAWGSYFRTTAKMKHTDCLRQSLMAGGPINCRRYPEAMSLIYANAVVEGASFVRYFPPSLLGTADAGGGTNILQQPPSTYSVVNATFNRGDLGNLQISAGNDVQIPFTIKDNTILESCLAIKLEVSINTTKPAFTQLFYMAQGDTEFSQRRSVIRQLPAHSNKVITFTVVSPSGFLNSFRFDPVSDSQPVDVRSLTLKCVLRR